MQYSLYRHWSNINLLMNYSIYIHIPFCIQRCHYCDFNTYAGKESLIPDYIDALVEEIRIVSEYISKFPVHSIYLGGGTPSLIPVSEYQKLFKALFELTSIVEKCEISLEANPGTVSLPYLTGLRALGFNRISFGIQSTSASDLIRLGRTHTLDDILDAIVFARRAGFHNNNLDMINHLPWQDLTAWKNSLSRAVALAPEHFSIYSLMIEPGTSLHDWYQRGLVTPPDEDLGADMYEFTMDYLDRAGYEHYEISNWAKLTGENQFRCLHNMQYWLNQPYIGLGAGAHGYISSIRTENVPSIEKYIARMREISKLRVVSPETPATINSIPIDEITQMKDSMWLALRLVKDGVSLDQFERSFGYSVLEVFKDQIEELLLLGLIEWGGLTQSSLKLTRRGIMVANQVFLRFI